MADSTDVHALQQLGILSWQQYEQQLTPDNWELLKNGLFDKQTYIDLLNTSQCIICTDNDEIVGMSYLVPQGNPTDIYDKAWCYIRFVSVHPKYAGRGIGRLLTEKTIALAKQNKEKTIALHTSEMMDKARHIYESLGFTILKEIAPRFGKKYWLYTMNL